MPAKASSVTQHVIATLAYVAHTFELVLELEELAPEDHQILVEQTNAAGQHLADAIWALHPAWRDLDRRASEKRALELFREHRPEIDESARGVSAIVSSLNDAIYEAFEGALAARDGKSQRRYRDVAADLGFATDHLENAVYLLDPDSFRAAIDSSTASQRVKLASRLEVIELELDEHRQMIRHTQASASN